MRNLTEVKAKLIEILDVPADMIWLHTIARNNDCAVGVYIRNGSRQKQEMLGGEDNRAYGILPVTILLRWGKDGVVAEAKADEIYSQLTELDFSFALFEGPVWLGADGRGVFEYTVDIDFLYEVG